MTMTARRGSACMLGALLLWAGAAWAASAAPATPGGDDETPAQARTRIAAQRRDLETRFGAQEAECRSRFSVTACLDDVKARRRDAMSVLREQELKLDDAERKARATARLQALEDKRRTAAARSAAAPVASAAAAAPRPAASGAWPPAVQVRPPRHPQDGREAEAAARRAAAARQRREAAARDRARIAAREAQRASNPKRSAPLPLPPELAASATGR